MFLLVVVAGTFIWGLWRSVHDIGIGVPGVVVEGLDKANFCDDPWLSQPSRADVKAWKTDH